MARALLATLALAAPAQAADFPFSRVAQVPRDARIAVGGGRVYAAAIGFRTLNAYPLAGGEPDTFVLPDHTQTVETVDVTRRALVVQLFTDRGWTVLYGRPAGPLRRLHAKVIDMAATGGTVLALERLGHEISLVARDVAGGPARVLTGPRRDPAVLRAAGHYAAFYVRDTTRREQLVVVDIRHGRELYRVPTGGRFDYQIAPDGRLVLTDEHGISTATPADPRPRRISHARLYPYGPEISGHRIVVQEQYSPGYGRLLAVGLDGVRRRLTPIMPIDDFAYDGRTLAFTSGDCLYAGPLPDADVPASPPPPSCSSSSSSSRSGMP